MRLLDWLCYRIVMAWPLPLPDSRDNRAFAWILARAGEYANTDWPTWRDVRDQCDEMERQRGW